ncbi:hypothetical protein WT09_00360 [Burkholderia stagnalis]|nr:hypothetical protein WS59_08840 [Burkholderia stagnalis]KVL97314.1 hypothetical protein WT03_09610 [Burkholderia stagnalis]KVL99673.1 hypothetical protein WT02_08830 [Burkholderia stagnalis]KVM10407.1 hypothetical protein WT04_16590 [Burkholderia stagnalis]KVM90229.1 hypothetical protein WT05_02120 [Burkholderia stagnalis]
MNGGIEMPGLAAGEARNPEKSPHACRSPGENMAFCPSRLCIAPGVRTSHPPPAGTQPAASA